jgi:DNA-binding SARP family transcriptional activator/TolB-like protein
VGTTVERGVETCARGRWPRAGADASIAVAPTSKTIMTVAASRGAQSGLGAASLEADGPGLAVERLRIHLFGPTRVLLDHHPLTLPRSRKARVLLAYLALAPSPTLRSRLCDLLWDVPNDPRGELRWCLSKLRGILDVDRPRVVTTAGSLIALDLSDCWVDALAVEKLVQDGVAAASTERLSALADACGGDLLDGLVVDGAELAGWLVARRQRYRDLHVEIVRTLVRRTPVESDEHLRWLQAWLMASPYDADAHEAMIGSLVKAGRLSVAEQHLHATIRSFESEGLDWTRVRAAWQAAREAGSNGSVALSTVTPSSRESLEPRKPADSPAPRPGSVLVMPFVTTTSGLDEVAHGLTDELITKLAKLRVLFVIARGTSYALHARGLDAGEAARLADVEYAVTGTVRRRGRRLSIHVELVRSRDAGIVWGDRADATDDEPLAFLDASVDRMVAAIAEQIEQAECKRAIGKPPSSLDAWEAYHRGLWHMYLFTGPDNQHAQTYFRRALTLDPTFARAYAGLSFTHFQNVFLGLEPDRQGETMLAFDSASRSVAADDRDPAAHWALGRALWLRGETDESVAELERSVDLSPNFALGHYTLSFVHAQSGDPDVAMAASDTSRQLSPFDPLQFAMLASRSLAHLRLGQLPEAAAWAVRAAGRPNAHVHILAIAAATLALCNRHDEARLLVARIRNGLPGYDIESFLRAFRFTPDAANLFRLAAAPIGLA